MTANVFVENATAFNFILTDQDGNNFGQVLANGYYSLKLNYSPTFEKIYRFTSSSGVFSISLSVYGEIVQLFPNNQVHLEVKPEEYTTRVQVFPPPLKNSNSVSACCHLYGPCHNKLLITPYNHIFARVVPILAPPVPDYSLRLDFV